MKKIKNCIVKKFPIEDQYFKDILLQHSHSICGGLRMTMTRDDISKFF